MVNRIVLIALGLGVLQACQTPAHLKFHNLKPGMTKDEVLEIVGSPNRSDFKYSKEKWSYKFFTGEGKNVEDLRQVVFIQGKVDSFGIDDEEILRQKEIREYDQKRAAFAKAKEKLESAGGVYPIEEPPSKENFTPMSGTIDPKKTRSNIDEKDEVPSAQ